MNSTKSTDHMKTFVSINSSILHVIKVINDTLFRIALVVDRDNKLIGTITDGDVRRGILSGVNLEESVSTIMNARPCFMSDSSADHDVLDMMHRKGILQLPLVDSDGRVVRVEYRDTLRDKLSHAPAAHEDIWVILMLGGLGTRLQPLTDKLPKPMIEVGGKPLLETIVSNFVSAGFFKFYFSLNYKADVIQRHFGNGERFGCQIEYIIEEQKLGTAGALQLIEKRPPGPFIVMNGDVLTNISFIDLVEFHCSHGVLGTMCVREYANQIPYGIVQNRGVELQTIVEKPVQNFFVNAGIYVLDPAALEFIPKNTPFDMPKLFDELSNVGEKSIIFPIHEYWRDIGQLQDLHDAREEYEQYFS